MGAHFFAKASYLSVVTAFFQFSLFFGKTQVFLFDAKALTSSIW